MLEIIVQGRGGQGAQTAGNVLAKAFFDEGRFVQAFASYGGARRGTPVSSYIRIDDKPIRRRCNIQHPDAILCFDSSLLTRRLLEGADQHTVIVVNTPRSASDFEQLAGYRLYPIDGLAVAERNGLGRIVNSALIGAVAAVLEAPAIDTVRRAIAESAPVKKSENVRACMDGYDWMHQQLRAA